MATVRWTDEMLDELSSNVSEMRESITEMGQVMNESFTEIRDSIDGLRVTSQALLQVAAQSQRDMELLKQRQAESDQKFNERQAENDQRFNILLEEVRHLSRRLDEKEGK